MKKKLIYIGITLIVVIGLSFNIYNSLKSSQGIYTKSVSDKIPFYEESYKNYLEVNGYNGQMSNDEIEIDLKNYTVSKEGVANLKGNGIETSDQGKVTWEFDVKKSGFYNLEIGYIPLKGTNSSIERKLYIDDEILFDGMEQLSFHRSWVNETDEIQVKRNNEVRPNTIEDESERIVLIEDSQKRVAEPYRFYLEEGKHTLTLESMKEPMKITKIKFKSEDKIMKYEEFIEKEKSNYQV